MNTATRPRHDQMRNSQRGYNSRRQSQPRMPVHTCVHAYPESLGYRSVFGGKSYTEFAAAWALSNAACRYTDSKGEQQVALRATGFQGLWATGFQGLSGFSGSTGYRFSGSMGYRFSGSMGYRFSGSTGYRFSGSMGSRFSGFTGFTGYRFSGSIWVFRVYGL